MTSSITYFFQLGANPSLSKAELSTLFEILLLPQSSLKFFEWKNFLFVTLEEKLEQKIIRLLKFTGSIVKMGKIVQIERDEKTKNWPLILDKFLDSTLYNLSHKKTKQVKVALNIQPYYHTDNEQVSKIFRSKIKSYQSYTLVKYKTLSPKKFALDLSPFQYHKENMAKRGIEYLLFYVKSKMYLGYTLWVSNPFEYIKQDEERPSRLFTHGTSLKVARTLVFLAKIPQKGKMLDPFCGSGTLLQVALEQGISVIGVDQDPKCIKVAKENLQFFSDKYFGKKASDKPEWQLVKHDARKIDSALDENSSFNAIVTEPYLGPFLKSLPEIQEAEETMKKLEKLYNDVILQASLYLQLNERVVMILPNYHYKGQKIVKPNIENILNKTTYEFLGNTFYFNQSFPISIGREHNVISREIIVLIKK